MSVVDRYLPAWTVERPRQFLEGYGLGILFSANVFGAGSIYILSNTGANWGFLLLWALPVALLVDLSMHEMSGRLATIDQPVVEYIRDAIGAGPTKVMAVLIAFIMHFWAISNYAVAGAAFAYLTPLNNVYIGAILAAGIGISLVELRIYDRVEAVIAALILTVFAIYIVLALGLDLPFRRIASGLVPVLQSDIGFLTSLIALFGTTVYYPNFIIQSSIQPTKEWTDIEPYRKDNFVGIAFVILLSMAVMVVSALTLDPGTPTLTSPGQPLQQTFLGTWAVPVFVLAVLFATFSSATGTLFGAGFLVPQAWGLRTTFGDKAFRRTVEVLIVMAVGFAILLLEFTDITPVQLGIAMPAVNGLIGLPLFALALFFANRKFFDHPRWLNAVFAVVTLLMFVFAFLTARGLYDQIVAWL